MDWDGALEIVTENRTKVGYQLIPLSSTNLVELGKSSRRFYRGPEILLYLVL